MCASVREGARVRVRGNPRARTGTNYEARGGARLYGTVRDSEQGEREMNSGRGAARVKDEG